MMIRLFTSALLVAGLSQAALAQTTTRQDQPSTSAENAQTPQSLPQSLRQRLTSAGFSDVNIVPSSLVITAMDRAGRPVLMRITPTSMFLLTEIPAASSATTGMGMGNENESAQQNQPSASAENTSGSAENTAASAEPMQTPQTPSRSLRQRLMSAGFTDVNIVPSSFVITGRDNGGHPVLMRITPNSMFFLTEVPVASSSSTTGAGMGMPNDTGQSR